MSPEAAADRIELAIIRGLLLADVTEATERVRVLALVRTRLDRHVAVAVAAAQDLGESDAVVGRALGISRQAARERRLRRVGQPPA